MNPWFDIMNFKNPLTKKQTYGLNLKISKASSKFYNNTIKFPKGGENQNKVNEITGKKKEIKPKFKKQNQNWRNKIQT